MTVTGVVFIPLLVALFAVILAALERRERRRQEAELDRLRALLAARNGHAPEWVWPDYQAASSRSGGVV
jgi:type II secretory pathway component PulM